MRKKQNKAGKQGFHIQLKWCCEGNVSSKTQQVKQWYEIEAAWPMIQKI